LPGACTDQLAARKNVPLGWHTVGEKSEGVR
jgi:hypothetical protein